MGWLLDTYVFDRIKVTNQFFFCKKWPNKIYVCRFCCSLKLCVCFFFALTQNHTRRVTLLCEMKNIWGYARSQILDYFSQPFPFNNCPFANRNFHMNIQCSMMSRKGKCKTMQQKNDYFLRSMLLGVVWTWTAIVQHLLYTNTENIYLSHKHTLSLNFWRSDGDVVAALIRIHKKIFMLCSFSAVCGEPFFFYFCFAVFFFVSKWFIRARTLSMCNWSRRQSDWLIARWLMTFRATKNAHANLSRIFYTANCKSMRFVLISIRTLYTAVREPRGAFRKRICMEQSQTQILFNFLPFTIAALNEKRKWKNQNFLQIGILFYFQEKLAKNKEKIPNKRNSHRSKQW